jgi:DNA repair protein RecN (Recombination protein N)
VVEGLIDLGTQGSRRQRFEEAGFAVADGQVVIRRVISRSGRGRITINGQLATGAMLAQLTRGLIDVSGQHEHVSLLDPEHQLDLVDAFGDHRGLLRSFQEAHGEVLGLASALEALQMDEGERARREDLLRYQIEEVEALGLEPGELEALEVERKRLQHAGKLLDAAQRAEARLYSDDGAIVEALGRIQVELVQLARLDRELEAMSGSASSALAELEDLAKQLGRYSRSVAADPGRLVEVDERVEAIKRVTKKHGGTVEATLAAKAAMEDELDGLTHDEARRADLGAALEEAEARRTAQADQLSAARAKASKALEKAVQAELASLSMSGTQIRIVLVKLEGVGARGAERAEIAIAPNPGEPLLPLAKIASGGELSRILLAFKRVLAAKDGVATYVFDEVDSGIGGRVADVLGQKLLQVAAERQVLCITHLPQIAAYADAHWRVHKESADGRTVSKVSLLDAGQQVDELARMLGGVEITPRTRELARDLIARARSLDRAPQQAEAAGKRPPEGAAAKNGAAVKKKRISARPGAAR